MPSLAVIGIIVLVALLVVVVLFTMTWRVAEPDQSLIVTGLGARGETDSGSAFTIVVAKGAAVIPGLRVARKLSLDTRSTQLEVDCVTQRGIALQVKGVVIHKVGDDPRSISDAARRWLDQQQIMDATIHDVFAGHLRSIVGGLTVEEMIRQRERLTNEVRAWSAAEMAKLGPQVDSLQIQEIDDATGYLVNLGAPLSKQDVVVAETRAAELAADLAEKRLESGIRQPADAQDAAVQARPDALAKSMEAVIAQQIAENCPAIVSAGASAFQNIDQLVVLDGAEGGHDELAQIIATGGSATSVAKQFLSGVSAPAAPAASTDGRSFAVTCGVRVTEGATVVGRRTPEPSPSESPCTCHDLFRPRSPG